MLVAKRKKYNFEYCMMRKCNSCKMRSSCEEGEKKNEKRIIGKTEKVCQGISERF